MAERRMFAKSIVLSDAFLDMPLSARCLYFTLGMLADDDGFVGSPKSVMRQCGASQDDMMMLLQKRYVLGFDNGIIVIKHWRMNNYLQNDRHKSTTYLEELETLEIDEKGAYTERREPMYTECIQTVYTDKDRLDKDRLGKDRLGEVIDTPARQATDYQKIVDMFNSICISYPQVKSLSDNRKKAIKARLKTYSEADIQTAFEKAEASDFLKGRNNRNWSANFDWLMKDSNLAKVLDGNYDVKAATGGQSIFDRYRDA